MSNINFFSGENVPLEMHKVRMVQKLTLLDAKSRLKAMEEAGNNTFLLQNKDVFLDMLSDSGVNAMSDRQFAAMFIADDAYAGSESFTRLEEAVTKIFGTKFLLPAHQGRACENILAHAFVKPGQVTLMNYHFTTTKAHITRLGGVVEEIHSAEALNIESCENFKGDIDVDLLNAKIDQLGKDNVAFVRIEAGTNLIGGQPVSLENMRKVAEICRQKNIISVFDASLLSDNLYFIKIREEACKNMELNDITKEIGSIFDITYFSARKLGCAKGGCILTNNEDFYNQMKELVPLFEGFLTYGGMSLREMEALSVGLIETLDMDFISQTPIFVEALTEELIKRNIPVVTPAGGLGCHINAGKFLPHIPQSQYPAGALACAIYLCGGIRGMERGTMSEQRTPEGEETFANMELIRLAIPKRVYTLSHMKFVADRIGWLYENRELIGGLEFSDEPKVMRFFLGRLKPTSDWQQKLIDKFMKDMPSGI